jgi:hypothetical protein
MSDLISVVLQGFPDHADCTGTALNIAISSNELKVLAVTNEPVRKAVRFGWRHYRRGRLSGRVGACPPINGMIGAYSLNSYAAIIAEYSRYHQFRTVMTPGTPTFVTLIYENDPVDPPTPALE